MNKKLLVYACFLILFLWLVNTLANQFFWYSAMWWFDIPMHFLGGAFLSVFAGSVFFTRLLPLRKREQVVMILLFVLVIGICWEFFEYCVQWIVKDGPQLANIPDSIKDIFMDIIGGSVASLFVLARLKRYNRNHARHNER